MFGFKKNLFPFIILTLITLLFVFKFNGSIPELKWESDLGSIFTRLAGQFILTAALLDQFIALSFPENEDTIIIKNKLKSKIKINNNLLKDCIGKIIITKTEKTNSSELTELINERNAIEEKLKITDDELSKIDNERSLRVRRIAFGFGLILSVSGITFLSQFFTIPKGPSLNLQIIMYADMIFSAALLSGGTSGVAKFLDYLKGRLKNY